VTVAELARKVRLVELRARRASSGVMSGAWHSAFKGRGIEFHEVREYVPGDDVRAIDWNVTARAGRPYIKRFAEERDQTVMLLVDASRSNCIPGVSATKSALASELCALLAFAAAGNRDAAGLILFTDEIELYLPPGRGVAHVLRLIREVLAFQPGGVGTRISSALEFLARVQRRRSLVFLISDFQDRDWERPLSVAARRHELIALPVSDPREQRLPDCGLVAFHDPESGVRFEIDTSDPSVRLAWEASARDRAEGLRGAFRKAGVDHLSIEAGTDYTRRLVAFLQTRAKRD
jgi:uncharacterized protein (DUF58 family)